MARSSPEEDSADNPGAREPKAADPALNPQERGGSEPMISTRITLPTTRRSLTHKFSVGGHEGYLTVGLQEDGRPGELFLKISKEGSTVSGLCQAYCRAFSLALQYGLPIEDAVARFKGMRFEPQGPTSNPEIPDATSLIDYIARFLELEFVTGRRAV